MWISIKKDVVHLYEDLIILLIIGSIYIPPYSRYSSLEIFDELEREIVTFSFVTECICHIGDLNSWVACEKDYIDLEDFVNHVLDTIVFQNACSYNDYSELQKYGFFLDRESNDNTTNQYRKKLINICKNCSFFFWNARSKHDKNGEYTVNPSV